MLPPMTRVKFNCVMKFVFVFSTYLKSSVEARSASRVDGYWLNDKGIVFQFAIVEKVWLFLPLLQNLQTACGAYPAFFHWLKRPGREADPYFLLVPILRLSGVITYLLHTPL